MKDNIIDLNKTVYELCENKPEITKILEEAGFQDITKPGMLMTVGRFMTIPKGAALKKIDLKAVKRIFTEHNYQIKEEVK